MITKRIPKITFHFASIFRLETKNTCFKGSSEI